MLFATKPGWRLPLRASGALCTYSIRGSIEIITCVPKSQHRSPAPPRRTRNVCCTFAASIHSLDGVSREANRRLTFAVFSGNELTTRYEVLGGTTMLISNRALFDLACRQSAAAERCGTLHDHLRAILRDIWRHGHDDGDIPASAYDKIPATSPALRLVTPSTTFPGTSPLRVIPFTNDVQQLESSLNPSPADDQNEHSKSTEPVQLAAPGRGGLCRWRRHPQLRIDRSVEALPESERRARLAAVRGVFAARDGHFDTAAEFFLIAAREPAIDLGDVPGFWRLSRSGMQAAIDAYEDADRVRDASALTAKIRTVFRPRPLRQPRQLPIRPPRRVSSNGSG